MPVPAYNCFVPGSRLSSDYISYTTLFLFFAGDQFSDWPRMVQWIRSYQAILMWSAATSAVIFACSLIIVSLFIIRLPDDYFAGRTPYRKIRTRRHPIIRAVILISKNLLGCILILSGFFMLVLPGQGVLTILVGIMLLNFPGKYRVERWIVSRGPVLRSMNWLRRKAGRGSLVLGR